MRIGIILAVVTTLVLMTSNVVRAQSPTIMPPQWQSQHGAESPLVGQIFFGNGTPANPADLLKRAARSKFVLLGESHDNPDHHLIQAAILDRLVQSGKRPAVVWEMVPQRLAPQLNTYDLAADPQLDQFAIRLEWEKRGWYSWDIYRPIALVAARHGLPMAAGDLDRPVTRAISKSGFGALSPQAVTDYALDTPLPQNSIASLEDELRQSHCDMLPEKALPAMINVQRARDGALAHAMVEAAKAAEAAGDSGAVLITGNGHIRKDRAVPFVLRQKLDPAPPTLAIGIIEVMPDGDRFSDYELANTNGSPLYDFVVFTPQYDNSDHCAALRAHFKKLKKTTP